MNNSRAREILLFALQKKLYFTTMPLTDLLFDHFLRNKIVARDKWVREKD